MTSKFVKWLVEEISPRFVRNLNFYKVYSVIDKSVNISYAVKAFDKLKFTDIDVDKVKNILKLIDYNKASTCKGVVYTKTDEPSWSY